MTYPNLVIALFPEVEPAASGLEAGGGGRHSLYMFALLVCFVPSAHFISFRKFIYFIILFFHGSCIAQASLKL